ncbi:MAG: hypothetical protein JXA99_16925 [Candidatus Lokiarchaeota archaeon]|nr:hypothetical protein [Candidatus Lokiarchaeota archaeon]
MPVGIVIMRWDERIGTEILAKFPPEISVNDKTLMQIYSTHEYGGESGMISLMIGSLNIASYYTGPNTGYYLILLLNIDEDPDAYEGGLTDVARTVLLNIDEDVYLNMVPTLFRRLSVYPTYREEQKLAITYGEEIKRMIIKRLREEGVISKSELSIWLKDQYKHGFVDLEGIVIELIKQEIIKEASVKGMPSELIFLTNDIFMMRIPPEELINNPTEKGLPAQLSEDFIVECRKFFQNYRPSEEDNLSIINILSDPEVYETIRLLRTAVVTRSELEKLKKKGVENVSDVLKKLWNNQMIQVFQDKDNNEYYALLSDFYVNKLFPKYILNIIKREYVQKSKADKVLSEYLTVLENTFLEQKKASKVKN